MTEEEERARFFTQIFRTYSSVLFCCAAGIIWLCRPVMHVMKSNYYYAWHFVPFLVLASTCSCFNQFMNSVYVVTKKSQRSMVTMMAGAISNCIMNYFFIKWWGPVGATLCVLPWLCTGVHPACGGRPPHDRDARPPGAGAGKRRRAGV